MSEAERALFRRRALGAVLFVSLVLNAFFVGLAVTEWRRDKAPAGPRVLRIELRWLEKGLTGEGVKRIEAALARLQPDVEARIARLRTMRGEVNVLAAAQNPDRAAIDAKIAAIKAESVAIQAEVEKTTYDALMALPPEMRRGLGNQATPAPSR